jgi:aerobic carbon-monoxide dehydrogenase medium subunit
MIPAAFDYAAPATLDEAIDLLTRGGGDAKVLSGGQSLLPLLKLRMGTVGTLVDLRRVPGLSYIKEEGGRLRIGGATRECELERSELVRARYPLLFDTALVIADPLVRNRATVGGNLAHGDPANDHPATMLAYGAEIVAHGPKGERTIAVGEFFRGPFETALAGDEILTEVRIPAPATRSGGAYFKLERKVGDFATAAVAVQLTLAADGAVQSAGIGLTNVADVPVKAGQAETFLKGKKASPEVLMEAGRLAAEAASPTADWKGSVEYKRNLTRVLAARALAKAIERAGGK